MAETDTQFQPGPLLIDGYEIDAYLTEQHQISAEISDYRIESGGTITDNRRRKPRVVKIEGIVSDSPLGIVADIRNRQIGLSTTDANTFNDGSAPRTPSQDALRKLEAIDEKGEPIIIATALKVYTNMLLEDLDIPRDAETGRALRFTATFKQVTLIANTRVRVRTAKPSGQGKSNKGRWATDSSSIPLINVISFPIKDRAEVASHKVYGDKPVLTDTSPPLGKTGGTWDHWKMTNPQGADGYIGNDKKYHPYGRNDQIADPNTDTKATNDVLRTAGRPVHYDKPSNSWRDNNDQMVTRAVPQPTNENRVPDAWRAWQQATGQGQ